MTGVVLCGGQSTRMGSDKGMLLQNSIAWVQLAASKLMAVGLPVVLSVNGQQYSLYKSCFPDDVLIMDDETLETGGPLKGILSVHLQHTREDLLVLACDMPAMQTEVLLQLISASKTNVAEAFVFRSPEHIEPLCGIYTSQGLAKIHAEMMNGQLKKHSMHAVLERLKTLYLFMPIEYERSFANFNSPGDLVGLQL